MKYIIQIAAPFIAPDIVSNPPTLLYQKAIFLVWALIAILVTSFGSIAYYASIGAVWLVMFSGIIFSTCVIALGILFFFRSIRAAANVLIGGLIVANTAAVSQTGGIFSIIAFGYSTPSILGLIFFSRRQMILTVLVSVGIIAAFMMLEANGLTPQPVSNVNKSWLWFGGVMIVLVVGTVGIFFFADSIRENAYKELELERNSIEERIIEATQALQDQRSNVAFINQRLEERNTELQEAIQTAETARKLQADILRNIDHEMRTPLAVILGFAEILHHEATAHNPAMLTFVEQITTAGENLLDTFNNAKLLKDKNLSELAVHPKSVHLPSFLQQQCDAFKAAATQKGLTITCAWSPQCEEAVLLDLEHLTMIMRELLSNAVKFTNTGSVALQCAMKKLEISHDDAASFVEFRVIDTGIGIAAEFMEKVFLPFHQQDSSTTRDFGGLGLGLAAVFKVVEALGGRVWCESELGNGTVVTVLLPQISP